MRPPCGSLAQAEVGARTEKAQRHDGTLNKINIGYHRTHDISYTYAYQTRCGTLYCRCAASVGVSKQKHGEDRRRQNACNYCCLHNSWRSRVFGRKPKFWSRLKILFYNARSTLILRRNWMKLVPLEPQKAQLSAHMKIINKFRVSEIVEKSLLPRHQPLSFERSLLDHLPP